MTGELSAKIMILNEATCGVIHDAPMLSCEKMKDALLLYREPRKSNSDLAAWPRHGGAAATMSPRLQLQSGVSYACQTLAMSSVKPAACKSQPRRDEGIERGDIPMSFVLNMYTPYTAPPVKPRRVHFIIGPRMGNLRGWM